MNIEDRWGVEGPPHEAYSRVSNPDELSEAMLAKCLRGRTGVVLTGNHGQGGSWIVSTLLEVIERDRPRLAQLDERHAVRRLYLMSQI